MILHIYFLITQIFISLQVLAESVTPTFLQGCALLQNNNIYCFGGAKGSIDIYNNFQPVNQFITLNLTNSLTFEQINNNWEKITPISYDLEPRAEFASAVVNGSKKWIIESGAGKGDQYLSPTLTNISICFDIETNQWSTLQLNITNNESTYSPGAIQLHGAASGTFRNSNNSAVVTYGGFRMGNDPPNLRNTSVFSVSFTSRNKNWQEINVIGFETPGTIHRGFRSQVVVINETLYSVGGFTYSPNMSMMNTGSKSTIESTFYASNLLTSFKYSLTNGKDVNPIYNTESPLPTRRFWHSFTHVPDTSKILLYGGITLEGVCDDYFYRFDTFTNNWDLITFGTGVGPGKRYGHSAIVKGDILYILFGADEKHILQNDVRMLNITDMNWIEPINKDPSSPLSLSPGAIAGISIGSIVAGCLLIGATAFYIIRRKRINEYQPPEQPEFLTNNAVIKNNEENDEDDEDSYEISSYINNNNNSPNNSLLYPKPTLASNQQDEINHRELGIKPNDSNELLNQTYTTYPSKPGIHDHQDIAYNRLLGIKPNADVHDHRHPSTSGIKTSPSNHSIVLQLKKSDNNVKPTLD